jgi:hypothetical protein
LSGIGTIRLNLKLDNGAIDVITIRDAVYIPTSPFNLLPPQLPNLSIQSAPSSAELRREQIEWRGWDVDSALDSEA